MEYSSVYDSTAGIVETKIVGDVTNEETIQAFSEALSIALQHGCTRFLTDFREARIDASFPDVFRKPQLLAAAAKQLGVDVRRLRRASIIPREVFVGPPRPNYARGVFDAHEHDMRHFEDYQAGRRWLLE